MDEIKSGNNSFYIGGDPGNPEAEITFTADGDILTIDHTFVSENLRGRGIALKLVEKAAEYARAENKKIIPLCSYAKKVMADRAYADVLHKE